MAFFGGGASVDLASPSAIGSTTPNTGAFTTLSATPPANTSALTISGYSATGSNAGTILDVSGTWNTTGKPTGLKINVTDTASNSGYLLRVQRSGTDVFTIDSNPSTNLTVRNATITYYDFLNLWVYTNTSIELRDTSRYLGFGNEGRTRLFVDADYVLALRNSTNSKTFRIYNTFTSATNFERVNFRWASNEFILDAEKGSAGGTLRGVKIGSATTSLLGFYGATPVDQPATVADPTGGGTQDAEARTAINAIIDRLQELGLVAT